MTQHFRLLVALTLLLLAAPLAAAAPSVIAAGARGSMSDLFLGSLQYKLNAFVTFAYEQGYAANRVGALPLFRGVPSYATHNVRSEFATIFTF